ncbi:MAG: sigma-54-dependent Fis family transcriptional regulator [Bryobacterales bacterium]|nr:sigma-54-dependent Fis family transcriptional regulator [Bryobacterales bacterium]
MSVVAVSRPMRNLLNTAQLVAPSEATVLVEGESGAGKDIIARALHCFSHRADGPWVNLSCAALPDALLETELFGSDITNVPEGLYPRPGMLELADGGTLFLDEIGDLEMRVQAKLLRFLDGFPYFRLGGSAPIQPKVRLIVATNQKLEQAVAAGRFRMDLFHRLTQFRLAVPPLRDRVEDIVPLAEFFLEATREGVEITDDAKRTLELYPWPGNVRELQNVINMAAITARGEAVRTLDLPERLQDHYAALPERESDLKRLFHSVNSEVQGESAPGAMLQDMEKRLILQVLGHTGGHQERAANLLGISRRTLSRKLKQYGAETRESEALLEAEAGMEFV